MNSHYLEAQLLRSLEEGVGHLGVVHEPPLRFARDPGVRVELQPDGPEHFDLTFELLHGFLALHGVNAGVQDEAVRPAALGLHVLLQGVQPVLERGNGQDLMDRHIHVALQEGRAGGILNAPVPLVVFLRQLRPQWTG